jgi:hypothetical protein
MFVMLYKKVLNPSELIMNSSLMLNFPSLQNVEAAQYSSQINCLQFRPFVEIANSITFIEIL